jgi:N-acyl-D-amino-acid deacylase
MPTPVLAEQDVPMTGKSVAGYQHIDEIILTHMQRIDAQAATLAISRSGKLLYSRGYGWSDHAKKTPTRPDDLMRIASVTKPITSAMVHELLADDGATPDMSVFALLGYQKGDSAIKDARLFEVTLAHLLEHKGGWDRGATFDPVFAIEPIRKDLSIKGNIQPNDVIRFMLDKPLQFDPGEKYVYSNFGYCLLGRVLERQLKKDYATLVQIFASKKLKTKDILLGQADPENRHTREVWYPDQADDVPMQAIDSAGGLIASAPVLCRFLSLYWIDGTPRTNKENRHHVFFGSLPTTSAMVLQMPSQIDLAVIFNNRNDESLEADLERLKSKIEAALETIPN